MTKIYHCPETDESRAFNVPNPPPRTLVEAVPLFPEEIFKGGTDVLTPSVKHLIWNLVELPRLGETL